MMSLSDELLARPAALRSLRRHLSSLSEDLPLRSAFLIDETGTPFGAVGHVEFRYPHPLPTSKGSSSDEDIILAALLGERDEASPVMLSQISPRALLVVVLENPLRGRRRRAARSRLRETSEALRLVLESE